MSALTIYLRWCRRFAWPIMVAVAVVSVAAAVVAVHLRIDGDMASLLPESAPSVAGLERLERDYGGQIGRLTVVLQAQPARARPTGSARRAPDARLTALADRLVAKLGSLDGVSRVEARRPVAFFERRRLLYADLGDLERAQTRIDRRVRWEKKRANPLFVGLESTPAPRLDLSDLTGKYDRLSRPTYYVSDDGQTVAVFIYPSFPAAELETAQALVDRVDTAVDRTVRQAQNVSYGLTGRYKKRVDLQSMIESDLTISMALALVLLCGFLGAFIRSLYGTLMVVGPLVVGTLWTFAWAELAFGSLNILTAFLGAVLLGLGVDFGIHLYTRFHELRAEFGAAGDPADADALAQAFASTGRANVFSAVTTMVALGSLLVSKFRAFYEFGLISLGGLLLILVVYMLVFPCAVALVERYDLALPAPASGRLSGRISAWLAPAGSSDKPGRLRWAGRIAQLSLVVVALAAAVGLPKIRFIRDFSVVQSTEAPSWKLDKQVNALLGQSQTPAVVLVDSPAKAGRVAHELRRRARQSPNGYTIDKVVSLASFIPDDQPAKLGVLADIADTLRGLPKSLRGDTLEGYLDEVSEVVALGQITAQDLPDSLRIPFSRTDGPDKAVVLVFPAITLADMDEVDDYAAALRDLPGVDPDQGYDAISESLLLSDVIRLVERDAIWMLAISVLGLAALSIAAFRNRVLVLLQLVTSSLSILVALGFLGLLGIKFNFMNIVVLPIWVGLGVDASFHVLTHLDARQSLRAHATTALAIAAAYITSMIGFGTLLLARHKGLSSLGEVAVVGLGSILIVNLLVQVALVSERR